MATPRLRPVAPDERAKKAAPAKTVTEAAASGSARDLLVAMRARIAKAVEDPNTPARDLAALTKRLIEVVRDIEAIDARDEDGDDGAEVDDGEFDASAV
ncbi:MAG: hypothetical protein IPG16_02975 [Comamonadaceae bacterium]|nr:hypothetical protein [Comamonadaceae bacterium]